MDSICHEPPRLKPARTLPRAIFPACLTPGVTLNSEQSIQI